MEPPTGSCSPPHQVGVRINEESDVLIVSRSLSNFDGDESVDVSAFGHNHAGNLANALPFKAPELAVLFGGCLVTAVGVLAILASSDFETENGLFVVAYIAVLTLAIVYPALRFFDAVQQDSDALISVLCCWILCLVLTLGPQSRRRQIQGLREDPGNACEEGATAMWIIIVLALVNALGPLSGAGLGLLSFTMAGQYLVIGLIWPRPECEVSSTDGLYGALLGMSPLWASFVQLSFVSLLLVVRQLQIDFNRKVDLAWAECLQAYGSELESTAEETSKERYLQNGLERAVHELEDQEKRCRNLLLDVQMMLPWCFPGHVAHSWVPFLTTMCLALSRCCTDLKHSTNTRQAEDVINSALEAAKNEEGVVGANALSGWLQQSEVQRTDGAKSEDVLRRPVAPSAQQKNAAESGNFGSRQVPPDKPAGQRHGNDKPGTIVRPEKRLHTISGVRGNLRVGYWDFDAAKVDQEHGHVFSLIGFEFLRTSNVVARAPMKLFLGELESWYKTPDLVPYHSHIHGADMTNSFFCLLSKSGFWQQADLSEAQSATMILAALGHDVGHFGRNNLFLINSRHELAVTYNDKSVLENYHAASLTRLLEQVYPMDEHETGQKVLGTLDAEQTTQARQTIHQLILCTDMASHLQDMSSLRIRLGADDFDPIGDTKDQNQALQAIFRSSDIAHSSKDWALHQAWSARVVQEFHAQGDQEKQLGLKVSPLCERDGFVMETSQIGFLNFICLPTWKELARLEGTLKKSGRASNQSSIPDGCVSSGVSAPKMGQTLSMLSKRSSAAPGPPIELGGASAPLKGKTHAERPKARTSTWANVRATISMKAAQVSPGTRVSVMKTTTMGDENRKTTRKEKRRSSCPRFMKDVVLRQCEVNHRNWKNRLEGNDEAGSDASEGDILAGGASPLNSPREGGSPLLSPANSASPVPSAQQSPQQSRAPSKEPAPPKDPPNHPGLQSMDRSSIFSDSSSHFELRAADTKNFGETSQAVSESMLHAPPSLPVTPVETTTSRPMSALPGEPDSPPGGPLSNTATNSSLAVVPAPSEN